MTSCTTALTRTAKERARYCCPMAAMRVRPLTIVLVVLDAIFLVVGAVYLVRTAAQLPTFFPGHDAFVGHDADSAHRYITVAIAAFTVGTAALVAALFTTDRETTVRT